MAYWIPPEGGVGASGSSPAPRRREPREDKEITEAVHMAFFLDPEIDDRQYTVRTENGVVYLAGYARTERERRRVEELALGVEGVREVINEVRLLQE